MIKFRLIARLDIRNDRLIKTIRCEGVRVVGDPAEYARRYDAEGIDEILYLDVVASLYGRGGLAALLDDTTRDVFTPVSAGGGISSVADAAALLRAGADKVAVNTAAIRRPALITELAEKFGSQAVVVQIDAKSKGNGWEAYCDGARQPTGRDCRAWAKEAAERGAGELLVTNIDREGTRQGFDIDLAKDVADAVTIPTILCGGYDRTVDAVAAARTGVGGIAIAGALHYGRVSLRDIRQALIAAGVPVRFAA
jgi:cyclase